VLPQVRPALSGVRDAEAPLASSRHLPVRDAPCCAPLVTDPPRVSCEEHGVVQVSVPWAEAGSRFTAMFESLVIDWLKEASFSAVARRLALSWAEVDGIMSRAVERGLAKREESAPARIDLDETSFQKRHEYVTVVTDLDASRVVAVLDGRSREAVDACFSAIPASRAAVEAVAMDMWRAYTTAAAEWLPNARVCFDRFHETGSWRGT
jgi:transposase